MGMGVIGNRKTLQNHVGHSEGGEETRVGSLMLPRPLLEHLLSALAHVNASLQMEVSLGLLCRRACWKILKLKSKFYESYVLEIEKKGKKKKLIDFGSHSTKTSPVFPQHVF